MHAPGLCVLRSFYAFSSNVQKCLISRIGFPGFASPPPRRRWAVLRNEMPQATTNAGVGDGERRAACEKHQALPNSIAGSCRVQIENMRFPKIVDPPILIPVGSEILGLSLPLPASLVVAVIEIAR